MARHLHGELEASGRSFAIVSAMFHRTLTASLVEDALDCLTQHGCDAGAIDVVHVPGSFELPQMVSILARRGVHDAYIALGVLIRGETPHFDVIAHATAGALERLSVELGKPVAFGVITADTLEQAAARAGAKGKGWEAASAALQMADLAAEPPRQATR